ncbi:cilia- and flagella-associated protein 53-like [Hetaerina americana]|uniref:cilia- and flagella-associated protein 53-like n=1 Tax=Hetaerina americana TaxID=62018 RepID=UPI003A7F1FF1
MFSLQNCKNKFEEITERKNMNTTVKSMVDAGMKAVYNDLENRKDRLRRMLLEEEACYRKERHERVVDIGHGVYYEKISQAQDQRRQKEEERKKLVEEKRMQQFMSNYEPMRTMFTKRNNKQTFCAQLEQLKELEAQHNKELAEREFWRETNEKMLEKKAREEEAKNRESKKKMYEIAQELLRQQAEKKELRLQEEAMKANELREIEKLKEKARLEEIEGQKQIREKRETFRNLLKQQIAEREESLAKQNEHDALINHHIAETANQDLTRELIHRKKIMEETQKEIVYYKEYMEELKKERLQEDKRIDELIEEQRKYLDKLQVDKLCQENKARKELTKLKLFSE